MGRSVLRHLYVLRVSKGLRKSYLYTHMSHAVGAISSCPLRQVLMTACLGDFKSLHA